MRSASSGAAVLALFLTCAPAAAQEITLEVTGPSTELTAGSEFDSNVLMSNGLDQVQGWSFGVEHDPAALELLFAELGATTLVINQGAAPQFNVLDTDTFDGAGYTHAVVLNFTQPVFVPIEDDLEIIDARYRVLLDPVAIADGQGVPCEELPAEELQTTVGFSNNLRNEPESPPVQTVVTVAGATQEANLVDATVTVRCPGGIEITRCESELVMVSLEWEFAGAPEWDFLFLYRDGAFLAPLDVDQTSYTDPDVSAGVHEYTIVTFVVDDPASPMLLFAQCSVEVIPLSVTSVDPDIANWVGGDVINLTGEGFAAEGDDAVTSLELFAEGEDPIPVTIDEIIDDGLLTATLPQTPRLGVYGLRLASARASAELADAITFGFVRGEMNSEAPIDISDPQYLLGFLFLGGVAPPRCRDALDVTDDGDINIADAVVLLNFLFLGGPPPAAPHPDPGEDPTDDGLGCLE